ncbi:hypothetical protein C0995_002035, partial [Termitomyces sp. Mi166
MDPLILRQVYQTLTLPETHCTPEGSNLGSNTNCSSTPQQLTANSFAADTPNRKGVQTKKKYKLVALKVKLVAGTVPEDFH